MNEASNCPAFLPLRNCSCHRPESFNHNSHLRTSSKCPFFQEAFPGLHQEPSLPPPQLLLTCISQQHNVPYNPRSGSVPNAGPSSEPAHDSNTLCCQLGTKGKWLTVFGKGRGWRSVSGMWVRRCLHSGGRASITQGWHTSRRPESWKVCWILQPTPLVIQMVKLRPRKEGTCPGSSAWWQSQLGDQGHLGFSSALLHPRKLLQLSGKGKELGGHEDSNISRTQVGSGHSKYLTDGHHYQHFTFCVVRHSQEEDLERQASPHHGRQALPVSRALSSSKPLPPSAPLC